MTPVRVVEVPRGTPAPHGIPDFTRHSTIELVDRVLADDEALQLILRALTRRANEGSLSSTMTPDANALARALNPPDDSSPEDQWLSRELGLG